MIFRHLKNVMTVLAIGWGALTTSDSILADSQATTASGIGTFLPRPTGDGGDYFGSGVEPDLGTFIHNGSLDLIPIQALKFRFQNTGRGTDEEILHQVMYEDGSTIASRFRGIVELEPEFDINGNPTGQFTAEWNGTWVYTGGTGRFVNAKGSNRVTAINTPFSLTDFAWNFNFNWTGNLTLPNNQNHANVVQLSTVGEGCFDPANLGIGDPNVIPFPFVIGDGSGEGIYNGTPVGQASLDGVPIGPDQHWGTAQSIRPGLVSLDSTIWYPGVTGANPRPDAGGAPIHIMATELGEIWFNYGYWFELDNVVIIGRGDFRVVGGTGMFADATGTVYVRVESELSEVTGLPNMPVAPFNYDFKGFVELADGN